MLNANLPIIDIHTHLAGLGQGGTQCFIAPHKFNSLLYRLLRMQLGIYSAHRGGRFDQAYLERLDKEILAAVGHKVLDAVVIFAHDRVYLENGEPHPSQEIFVPNEYVFACCERVEMRRRLLPAISVHPYRRDAEQATLAGIERGAVASNSLS
jgi:hypothetical protein